VWILNGLAVRIAQALGLHRDGERLRLSPFQSEIRRRIWWHLLTRKRRGSEDQALENTDRKLLVSNVRLPANLNDEDLYPGMERLPEPRKVWTPVTFSLITIELSKAMQQLDDMIASSSPSKPPREEVRLRVMGETRARIENWLEYCNPVIPQHRITICCSRFLLQKLNFVTRLRWSLLPHASPQDSFFTEENLDEALQILNLKVQWDDGLLAQFAWIRRAYPQYHVAMYVLWHLYTQPEGPRTDSAWEAIEELFAEELWDESPVDHGSRWAVMAALRAKALSTRERGGRSKQGSAATPIMDSDSLSVSGLSLSGSNTPQGPLIGDMPGSQLGLGDGRYDWTDWEMLTNGLQLDNASGFWQ
jgi:hypothetical protein